jgi:hypothetical protein
MDPASLISADRLYAFIVEAGVTSAERSLLTESWIGRRNSTQWSATFRS